MNEIEFENGGLGGKFTIILNSALRDSRLSHRATGVLALCLSHARKFKFNRDSIVKAKTEGRDAVISALNELREFGYLENVKTRDENGRVTGEFYRFTDRPAREAETQSQQGEAQTAENQRPEKPDAGKPVRSRRPIERKPIQEIKPPLSPHWNPDDGKPAPSPIELPPWTEPYREQLTQWLGNRARKHKLVPEIKASSIRGLEYARGKGVLKEYCEYASEREWQSLGFAGHKEVIDKLAKENGKQNANGNFARPAMQEIKYTLGI